MIKGAACTNFIKGGDRMENMKQKVCSGEKESSKKGIKGGKKTFEDI